MMEIDPSKLVMALLDQVAYWANYQIHLGGPDNLALPLGLLAVLAVSLTILVIYTAKHFRETK